ncbi:lytic transglycosylase domain-containing protein [Novosphingobium sp. 9]|uniref:lytic transglycosylase domain-containing protein n=1 Tax=Novosphingobium sp. 9 TaxID=2025349 RepID=UPI0028CBADC6|nr:transglycosylase SLT domain-containing protein [Novosphingobium sp. 9]
MTGISSARIAMFSALMAAGSCAALVATSAQAQSAYPSGSATGQPTSLLPGAYPSQTTQRTANGTPIVSQPVVEGQTATYPASTYPAPTTYPSSTYPAQTYQPAPSAYPASSYPAPTSGGAPVMAASDWDAARAQAAQDHDLSAHQSVDRWRQLTSSPNMGFAAYAGFLISYPGYPFEERLRTYAENALNTEQPSAQSLVSLFDRFPPLTSKAAGRYAVALTLMNRSDARQKAVDAWRQGSLLPADEAMILQRWGSALTQADHDERMNQLLWQGQTDQASREIAYTSPAKRNLFMERLSIVQGSSPGTLGLQLGGDPMRDGGYVYARAVQARKQGNIAGEISLLANRPQLSAPVAEPDQWVHELLIAAKGADDSSAVRIAASIDDGFAPGTDVSRQSFKVRDDYTSLMWLGGTKALWNLNDPRRAAPLFYRYGAAAQTPGTRSKGFYWAGRAAAQGGDSSGAMRYFEMAARYPEYFYGQLSLERMGRSMPNLATVSHASPSDAERRAFYAKPITAAVRDVARDGDWQTTVRFFREISNQAQDEDDYSLVADLARQTGRRDLAVIMGQSAHTEGLGSFGRIAYPQIPVPQGANWTMDHALIRQESQFAQNALSHAGARGLMQLMPTTAREQAGKLGLSYDQGRLVSDAQYNIQLGDAYFGRLMDYFGGSTPLAVAAYNAGAGNVNKWLRANGDPRTGSVDWIDWIEKIPISETRNYVQRVMENAIDYDNIYPDRAEYRGSNPLSHAIGKRSPG